ncbi:MAG: hypothetical protein QXG35_00730 [Nitrososphaerota archaeon]
MSTCSRTCIYSASQGSTITRWKPMIGQKSLLAALMMALILLSSLAAVSCQEASLMVFVHDPLGKPLDGIEVRLIKGGEARRFLTNSTGYAEFRHLEPGEYTLQVVTENVIVGEKIVRIPDDWMVDVEARLAEVELRLRNLDDEPVKGLVAELRAGGYSRSAESDDKGLIRIARIPYSDLKDVGAYSLVISMGRLTLYNTSLNIVEPVIRVNATLPLVSLRLRVVNLEGEPVPRITIRLSSEGYSAESRSESGITSFSNLPSSEVRGVGAYRINVSMRVGGGDMPIYFEDRMITRSANISLIADLARLTVRVVDEDGEPIRGVSVSLSNSLMANFTSGATNENGEVTFENILLSRGRVGAGAYVVQAMRAGRIIGELRAEFEKPGAMLEIVARRGELRIKLVDYHGKPLAGYMVRLIDEVGGEMINATTNALGEAAFKLFYGAYTMEVYRDGSLIRSSLIQLAGESLEVKLDEVNFPLSIRVVDSVGRPIGSGRIELSSGDEILFRGELRGEPISLDLPYPLNLRCDIYGDDGRLLHREMLRAYGPGELVVELRSYVFIGGLMSLESIAAAIMLALIAACALFSIALIVKARRKG